MFNTLPYSTQAPQVGWLNIDQNSPPVVPNYQCHQEIYPWLGTISALLAMQIQNNGQGNALRTFMWNQYGRNAFNNEDFMALVCMTVDVITNAMTNRRYQSLADAVQDLVPKMAEMLCAMNLRLFPDLTACVPPQSEMGIRNVIQNFDNLSGVMNPAFTQRFAPQQQQMGWNQGNQGNQFFSSSPTFDQRNRATASGGNTSLYNQQPRAAGFGVPEAIVPSKGIERDFGGRYSDKAQPALQPQQFTQPVQQVDTAPPKPVTWYPSTKYPYLPAYNPYKVKLILERQNGIVVPTFQEIDVEYERHAVNGTFGATPKDFDITSIAATATKIHQDVAIINDETDSVNNRDTEEEVTVTTKVYPKLLLETSEEGAWFAAELKRFSEASKNDGIIPAIYRCYVELAQPVVASDVDTEFVKSLANSKAFSVAREILANATDINPEVLTICKVRLTNLINRILKQQLCIPKLEIEDFVEDYPSLPEHLRKKFGDQTVEALTRFQKEQVLGLFLLQDIDTTNSLTASYIEDTELTPMTEIPGVLFLTRNYSLTLLNCLSHQLGIQLSDDVSVMVTATENPVLYELLWGLFADTDARTKKTGLPFARHLLKTTDGRFLEATQGSLNTGACLLTLLK